MRAIFAVDEAASEAFSHNFPACIGWAQERTGGTGRPIKIVMCRAGEKFGKTIAEVTSGGVRMIQSGSLWKRKKLERLYGET